MRIRVVLFDVGGTLITPKPSVGFHYQSVAKKHGHDFDHQHLQNKFVDVWTRIHSPITPIDKSFWMNVVANVFSSLSKAELAPIFEDLYELFRSPKVWEIFPDVHPILKICRDKKLTTGVASNWDDRLPNLLTDLDLAKWFDYQFISYQIGFNKPAPQFFKTCRDTINVPSDEILFVGDDEQKDFEGAKKAGFHSIYLNRRNNSSPLTPMVESLAELSKYF